MATNVKILLRRGARSEISADTLSAGELGYTTDTNQLYIGTAASVDEIVFDPFANAHAIVQTYLDTLSTPLNGLQIDEDLAIKNIPVITITAGAFVVGSTYTIKTVGTTDFTLVGSADSVVGTVFTATGVGTGTGTTDTNGAVVLIATMASAATFNVSLYASARQHVEVLTEAGFSQAYANMHLESHASATGKRSDLFKKELTTTSGTFLKYAKTDATSFFIDYSLKQTDTTNTFIRVGTIRVINGEAITPTPISLAKLTDDNTEIWQDTLGSTVGTAEAEEFSNIEFTTDLTDGVNIKINYTQDASFSTEISYTVKRWTM